MNISLLRRQKQEPQLNFSRTFKEYEEGFGSPTGLRNLHLLTSRMLQEAVIVRGAESTSSYYLYFEVASGDEYRLRVGGYDAKGSSAGDPLVYHNGMKFSTIDRDRDLKHGVYARDRPAGESNFYNQPFAYWQSDNTRHITQLIDMIRPND
ncbi:microfibril-associated glycoprotein 4-like [Hyalella azteca]|uniref:Microfibril-associated glycoprotein 4-like n=1 Tax=Hyalella azteca TaxID=294128 RepID=A0A8B7NDL5_HYAAZ|nr:microfibril-associated glycoprotein 4-like [Hyalella azteca]